VHAHGETHDANTDDANTDDADTDDETRRPTRLIALHGVSGGGAPVRAAAPPSARGLSRALALIPTTAREVDVTDWTLLKAYEGAPALTSASPAAARHRFFTALTRDQATPANCSSQEDERNAASWSWDATDLSWEASSVFPDGAPACVLAFRPGFALAPVIAHFVRRGFHESLYHGVPIYTLPLRDASGAPWFSADPDLSLLNTAVLAGKGMLVLSPSPQEMRAVLDAAAGRAGRTLSDDAAVRATVAGLGTAAGAVILPGLATCHSFLSPRAYSPQAIAALTAALHLGQLHPYAALGVGYREAGTRPVGVVLMHYPDAATARSDLPTRRAIAAAGRSLFALARRPYRLESAAVHGGDLMLELRPAGDHPQILFSMVVQDDMLFAACPSRT